MYARVLEILQFCLSEKSRAECFTHESTFLLVSGIFSPLNLFLLKRSKHMSLSLLDSFSLKLKMLTEPWPGGSVEHLGYPAGLRAHAQRDARGRQPIDVCLSRPYVTLSLPLPLKSINISSGEDF